MSASTPSSLVLADSPLRARLAELQALAESLRDAIAQLDLDIETLRTTLGVFDARLHGALRELHARHQGVVGVVRQLERWGELLETAPRGAVVTRARRLEARRARELSNTAPEQEAAEGWPEAPAAADAAAELKTLYRRLARRYHPDLARDEEGQVRAAQLMVRINALYRAGDLLGLRALADQALGAEPADEGLTLEREVALLEARCARFREVRVGLLEELAALEACPTARLWQQVTQREGAGLDAFADLRQELGERTRAAYEDVRAAALALEDAVRRYNRKATELEGAPSAAVDRFFEARARAPLVRWSLEALATLRASPEVRRRAEWLLSAAAEQPAVVRLVLFTYASELVPHGLETLATLEALRARFEAAARVPGPSLEEALVDASALLELGVRRAGPKVAHTGLGFHDASLAQAVPLALRSHALRADFRRVLGTLGEHTRCPACARDVFAVPLYRLRGLDDLHAWVCPACGEALKSYWMPRGQDVQSVLNDAFLDLELLTEWTFRFGGASVSTQLLPVQLETLSVGQLKRRFFDDVLARHGVEVSEKQLRLLQARQRVPERRLLADCPRRTFSVAFAAGSKVSVSDALQQVRFRIRNRFRAEAAPGV
ncbi:MAG: hypothetical protein ACLPJH_05505 [Myxococcaceae bacterium]